MSTDTKPVSKVKQVLYIGGPVLVVALWLISSYLTNRPMNGSKITLRSNLQRSFWLP